MTDAMFTSDSAGLALAVKMLPFDGLCCLLDFCPPIRAWRRRQALDWTRRKWLAALGSTRGREGSGSRGWRRCTRSRAKPPNRPKAMEKGRKKDASIRGVAKGRKKDAFIRGVDDDGGASSSQSVNAEVGFAKLQGEDFEYYMQTYSIILGRNSKTSEVDVDLASLGGGMNISRHHARIFYDFARRRFALEVLGKNGCSVEGVLYVPGTPPVKLDSQDLLQMGEKQFYFLLPTRSLFGGRTAPVTRQLSGTPLAGCADIVDPREGGTPVLNDEYGSYDEDDANDEEEEEDDDVRESMVRYDGNRLRGISEDEPEEAYRRTSNEKPSRRPVTKAERRSRADREADNQRLLMLEEKEVITSVTTVLSDLCGPGEWVSVEKLHAELLEEFGNLWHHSRVRRYLTSEEWPTNGKPWHGLRLLLQKYPQHFVINNKSKGRSASEFISLVSLIS